MGKSRVRSGGCFLERDGVAERFELAEESSGLAFWVAAAGGGGARGGVEVAGGGAQAALVGLQVAVVAADRGHGCLLERLVEPLRALAGAAGAAFPGRLVV